MIYDSIKEVVKNRYVTEKYFLNWILVAELLCFMKRLTDKLNNDDVFAKY